MSNVFQSTPIRRVRRNVFDLSHDVKFSCKMGLLVPTLLQEVLPGDSFKINSENLIRFAPMVSPVMHNIKCFTHYFFVPNRILWDKFEDFISPDLSKEVPPSWPHVALNETSVTKGSLSDYLGLPLGSGTVFAGINASILPHAAYQTIWDEFYRDQNLVPLVKPAVVAGKNGFGNFNTYFNVIRKRAWMHDYFTSALPWQQKGPAVNLPMDFTDVHVRVNQDPTALATFTTNAGNAYADHKASTNQITGDPFIAREMYAETSNMDGNTTISDLRVAMRLQEWFEIAARGGSRYVEQLKVFWNVNSSDKRLNRPEFLGGTRVPVIISEVLQTSSSDSTSPQGTMSGHAISGSYGNTIRYRAEEHGFIIGIMSVMPNTAYQQGINRMWTRQSWEDYAWPQFAHLSEQPILNKELYVTNDGKNEDTFGFIPRFSEYRYTPSRVAGEFRDTLAFWHLGRQFTNRPLLNADFIQCEPSSRIFAVTTGDHLWCHTYHKIKVKRALPKYGVPTL